MDSPVKVEPLQPVDFPVNPGFKNDNLECDDSIEITHSIEITFDNLSSSHIELTTALAKISQVFMDNQKVSRVPNDFKLKLQQTCRFLNSIAEELKAIAGKCNEELTKLISPNKLHNFETYAWEDVEENASIEIISPVGSPVASKSEEDSNQVLPCEKTVTPQPWLHPLVFQIHSDVGLPSNPPRIQSPEDSPSFLLGDTPRENAPEFNPDVCLSPTSCQNLPQPNCNFLEAPPAAAGVVTVLYVNPTNSTLKESRKRQPPAAKSPNLNLEGQSVKRSRAEQNSHAAAEFPTPQEKSQDTPASNGGKEANTNGHDTLESSFQTPLERETCNSTPSPPSVSSSEHVAIDAVAVASSSQMNAAPTTSQKGNMFVKEAPQNVSQRVLRKRKIVPPARYQGNILPKKTAKPPKGQDSHVQPNSMSHAEENDQATEQKSCSGVAPPKNSSSTEHSKKLRFCESVKEFRYNASISLTEASTGTCFKGSTRQIVLKDTPSKPVQKRRQSQNDKGTKNKGRTYPTVETQVLMDPADPPAPVSVNQGFSGNNQSHEIQSTTSNSNETISQEIRYTSSLSQTPVTTECTGLQKILIKKLPSGELKSSLVPSSHFRQLEPRDLQLTSPISESTTRDPAPEPSSGPEVIHLKQVRIILNRLSPEELKKYLVPDTPTPQLSPSDLQSTKHKKEISPVSDLHGVQVPSTASTSSMTPSTSGSSLKCSSATDNGWFRNTNNSGDTIKIDKTPETCDDIDILNYSDDVIEVERDRPEKCVNCLRSFSSLTELEAHIDAKHAGEKSPERLGHEPVLITESDLQAAEGEPTIAPSVSASEGPELGNSFPSENFQNCSETPCPDQLPNDISATKTKENEANQKNGDPWLQCGYCSLPYKQLKSWLWHYKIKHPHNVPSRCPNCREKISIESADKHVCINV